MNNPVDAARARLAAIGEEAEKLREFIRSWEAVADFLDIKVPPIPNQKKDVENPTEPVQPAGTGSYRAVNPPTKVVVDEAIRVLVHRKHPMTRRALHQELWKMGVEVRGADPVKTLGTILWRATDRVIQLEGYGYWPKDIPYARAKYEPPVAPPPPDLDGAFD